MLNLTQVLKFGKTAGGAVWLDPEKTAYSSLQFTSSINKMAMWLNSLSTLLSYPFEEIEAIGLRSETQPHLQVALAFS